MSDSDDTTLSSLGSSHFGDVSNEENVALPANRVRRPKLLRNRFNPFEAFDDFDFKARFCFNKCHCDSDNLTKRTKMVPKPVFLDVDTSVVENKLKIASNSKEDEFTNLFGKSAPICVVPTPGFCIKSKELTSNTKVFVNVCYSDTIPPPNDISEEELVLICNTEEKSSFRVPMSIGEIMTDTDKNGNMVKITDVAVHPNFYRKIEESKFFKQFFIALAFEGLNEKHQLNTRDERVVLKNRKLFGRIQVHRIRKSNDYDENKAESNVKNYLNSIETNSQRKPKIETISSVTFDNKDGREPEYRLFRKTERKDELCGEFKLLKVKDSDELNLDVGEDRIIIETKNNGQYYLDVFIPFTVCQEGVTATFNKTSKILTIVMPLRK
ncbi:hypothetical protein FQA39_LY13654 [Lamprigera yunnana]|nr:hypothetical protein FQA39_LY13654 [Lamprigera yunnana]